jgi:hypothetical protein
VVWEKAGGRRAARGDSSGSLDDSHTMSLPEVKLDNVPRGCGVPLSGVRLTIVSC